MQTTTRRVVEAHIRLHELLSELVPARLRLEHKSEGGITCDIDFFNRVHLDGNG